MTRRFIVVALLSVVALPALPAGRALANCGSESSCPLEPQHAHPDARFLFDVNQLYIDQDQPRVGTEDAAVGAIPGHHDEVRTKNWILNFRGVYRPASGWALAANLPYVDRMHEHIHHHRHARTNID